jgi:sugar transferase (PEP-CTERM/EpsH1 system associated)
MRVLVVAGYIPFPPVGGGNTRVYHLLRALAGRHELSLVAFSWGEPGVPPPFPVRVIDVPWEMSPLYQQMKYGEEAHSAAALHALTHETEEPFYASFYQSAAMEERLRGIGREGFDVILIEGSYMARYLDALPADVPKMVDLLDLHTLMARREAESAAAEERAGALGEAERTLRYERRVASQCAACLAVSEDEAAAARALLEVENVWVVPNGVDTRFFSPSEEPPEAGYLLFTGMMDYSPNVDAACYFTQEILPLIRRKLPQATLHIVGVNPDPAVQELASESVVVHGAVPDMRPFFRAAEVVVVPLRRGGGTRLKILEAAASGRAIVSTSLGAEGLGFRDGTELLVADPAPAFAQAVVNLIQDEARRQQLERGACAAAGPYDWDRISSRFRRMIEALRREKRHAVSAG